MIDDLLKKIAENQADSKKKSQRDPAVEIGTLTGMVGETYLERCDIDPKAYLLLLELTSMAADQEHSSQPENDRQNSARLYAFKLAVAFGSFAEAVKYLKRFESDKKHAAITQPVHDACLYELPESKDWDVKIWRSLIAKNQPNSAKHPILDLLPLADKIEAYVKKNEASLILDVQVWLKETIISEYETKRKNKSKKETNPEFKDLAEAEQKKYLAGASAKSAKDRLLKLNLPLSFITKYASNLVYARANESPAAAALFNSYKIKEVVFDEYILLKPQDDPKFIPPVKIEGSDIHQQYKQFKLSKLDPKDPRAAILGKLTSCCQSLGDAGREPAKHGIINPRGGFYVVEDEVTSEIIAQCWAWCDEKGNIVFDSVEIQIDARRRYEQAIKDLFMSLANKLVTHHKVSKVLVGAGGATPKTNFGLRTPWSALPVNYSAYRDSVRQKILADLHLPFLNKIYKEQNPNSLINHQASDVEIKWDDAFVTEWSIIRAMNEAKDSDYIDVVPSTLREIVLAKTKAYLEWTELLDNYQDKYPNSYWERMKDLLQKGNSPNVPSASGNYCLLKAAGQGKLELVQLILSKGGDLGVLDNQGNSALLKALERPHMPLVKWLIQEKGVDLNAQNQRGESALNILMRRGMYSELDWFLKVEYQGKRAVNINDPNAALDAVRDYYPQKWDAVEFLVKNGLDINIKDKDGNTLAHVAARNVNLTALKWLKAQGASLTTPNYKGDTPLHFLLRSRGMKVSDMKSVAEWLLLEGQDFNVKGKKDNTILELICDDWYAKWPLNNIEWFIKQGVNPQDKAAILKAAKSGRMDIIEKFLDDGIDVNFNDEEQKSVLELLITFLRKEEVDEDAAVNFTCKFMARYSSFDFSLVLIQAAYRGYGKLADWLLNNTKLNLLVADKGGYTALHWASNLPLPLGKLIFQKGANINAKTKEGKTPLSTASTSKLDWMQFLILNGAEVKDIQLLTDSYSVLKNASFVAFLLEHGMNVNLPHSYGAIPLFEAINCADFNVIKLLVEKGANINEKFVERSGSWPSRANRTPLYFLIDQGRFVEVDYFIQKGAVLNVQDKRLRTPLHHAVADGKLKLDLVTVLLRANPDINLQDQDRNTPLHLACQQQDADLVRLLLQKNPNINLKNDKGMTPLQLAEQLGTLDIVEIFKKYAETSIVYPQQFLPQEKPIAEFHRVKQVPELPKPDKKLLQKEKSGAVIANPLPETKKPATKIDEEWATFLDEQHTENDFDYWKKMEGFLLQGISPNIPSTSGQYCLLAAAKAGKLDLIKLILEKGGDINVLDGSGNSVLLAALSAKQMAVVKWLITEKQLDPNCKNLAGETALYFMILNGSLSDLDWFIKIERAGKRLVPVNDPIAVFAAEYQNKWDAMEILVEAGLDINIQDNEGSTFAHVARVHRLKWLQSKGATLTLTNHRGDTPFQEALRDDMHRMMGSVGEVKWFIENHYGDPNTKNSSGVSPLEVACMNGWKLEEITWLIEHGASPNNKAAILQAAYHGRPDIIEKLMNDGIDLDIRDDQGRTLLEILISAKIDKDVASLIQGYKCPEELVKKLASRQKSFNGSALLFYAAKQGHQEVCTWLLSNPDVNARVIDEAGNTTLHYVANLPIALAKRLFYKGGDVNVKNNKGETPLAVVSKKNPDWIKFLILQGADVTGIPLLADKDVLQNFGFVKFLLEKGVDFRLANEKGETALSIATENGYSSVQTLLLKSDDTLSWKASREMGMWFKSNNTNCLEPDVKSTLSMENH